MPPELTIEQKIKTMLEDTCKGLASREELKSSVASVVAEEMQKQAIEAEKQKAADKKQLDAAVAKYQELEAQAKIMENQVKQLLRTRFSAIKDVNGYYKGIWPSLEMAKAFGLFVIADIAGSSKAAAELDGMGIQRRRLVGDNEIKAVTGTTVTGGAALIPTDFMGLMPVLLGQFGVFRQDALEWPMASDSAYAAVQTSDVVVYAPGSGTAPTASSPGFKNIGLNAKKMMTLTAIDKESTEDMAVAIGEVVGRSIARAFAKKEDQIAFLGDGTSTYFGFVGIGPALQAVDATITNIMGIHVQDTAGLWTAIDKEDILQLVGLVDGDVDDADCKWYGNRNFYYTVLVAIALGLGGVNATEVIQTGFTQNPQFLGRKYRHVSVMPRVKAAADHFPLLLGNLKQAALIGQSRAMTIETSSDAYFTTDQIGIRGTERIAINIHGVGTAADATDPLPAQVVALRADIA